ncbi:MAG: exodeoxyribonuclease VII large subunit [Gemmatimonadales bacterium]
MTAIAPAEEVWSVSELVGTARRVVEAEFTDIWVRGEIVACKAWPSGHWYFNLRDAASQVRCCMWKSNAQRAGTPPADGTEVFVQGRPSIYESKGEFQLVATRIIPTAAIGAAQQELERVKALLHKEGLFDVSRKRRLPAYAATVAVVTSVAGAALRDIITVTRNRWPAARVLVIDARVQGEGAVDELCRALRLVNRLADVDLCIVGRGGGAREDLAAFNAEAVCRALAAVRVPTISAVGHETDICLTDLIADLRAATPSAAAELAWADSRAVMRQLDELAARLAGGLSARARLAAERVERTGDRLHAAAQHILERRGNRISRLAAQLDALSPLKVLDRGYAVPLSEDGRVLKALAAFPPGRAFRLRISDGEVPALVDRR